MSTYAVVAVWKMDPAKADLQLSELTERIIPVVRSQPGFVRGRWTRAGDDVRHVAFIEFDTEANAQSFAGFVGGNDDDGRRAAAGVVNESIDVLEVVGSA